MKTKRARVENFIVNPKSISINELYGYTDPTTLEWNDGVFSNAMRTFVNNANNGEFRELDVKT